MSTVVAPPTTTPTPTPTPVQEPQPRRGGWFVKITILVIVVLWSIPTLGVLITSFRPEALTDTTGWWTALAHPFAAASWTLENYRLALDAGEFGNAFLNSLAVTIPSTVIPITIAAFAAYAFAWMDFKGRYVLFVIVVGLLVVPLQMALIPILRMYTQGITLFGLQIFPDLGLQGAVRRELGAAPGRVPRVLAPPPHRRLLGRRLRLRPRGDRAVPAGRDAADSA